jgi:hypothetical protein
MAMVGVVGLAAPSHAAYSPTPLPTWATNNTVFAVAVQGNTVYLGGKFTKLRNPATGKTMLAGGLAALNRQTGAPIWTATANGEVRSLAVAADGSKVFAGGTFTTVNGTTANHVAALSPSTGSPIGGWQGSASGNVRDLVVSGSALYLGGLFASVNGVGRGGLARLDAATGTLQSWKSGTSGGRPWAIQLSASGQDLVVGGNFTTLGGAPRSFLGSVSTTTGAVTSWNPAPNCGSCYVFDVDTDAASTYVASGGPGGHLDAYSASSGALSWSDSADGNVQAVASAGGLVYAGGHFDPHFAGQTRHQLAAVNATTGALAPFAPAMIKADPGVFAIDAESDALFVGGGFSGVGSATGQAHYAQFATQ